MLSSNSIKAFTCFNIQLSDNSNTNNSEIIIITIVYHKLHLLEGFIGDPFAQLKVLANPSWFIMAPITRCFPGGWTPSRFN